MRFGLLQSAEIVLLVLIALRILSFSEYALDSSIQAARRRLTTTIYEKDEVCDRFAKLLVSIQKFPKGIPHGSHPTDDIRQTELELAEDVHACTRETGELRSFSWTMNAYTLLSYYGSYNAKVASVVREILNAATTPVSAHKCSTSPGCLDWMSALSPSVLMDVVPSLRLHLDLAQSEVIPLYALLITCGVIGAAIALKRLTKHLIKLTCHSILSTPLLVLKLILSRKARRYRIAFVIGVYLSAYTVTPGVNNWTVLMRLVFLSLDMDSRHMLITAAVMLVTPTLTLTAFTSIRPRYMNMRKHAALADLDQEVAHLWLQRPAQDLERLNPFTLIRILRLLPLQSTTAAFQAELMGIIMRSPLLMSMYQARDSYAMKDSSPVAICSRDMGDIVKQLGLRSRLPVHALILASVLPLALLMLSYLRVPTPLYYTRIWKQFLVFYIYTHYGSMG